MRRRTPEQRYADALDLELFRLLQRVLEHANKKVRQQERAPWRAIAMNLAAARYDVQRLMHPDDVEQTKGEAEG